MALRCDRAAAGRTAGCVWAVLCAAYAVVIFAAGDGLVADGYDGVGFVLAVDRMDLAHFQPHPPGFPLYIAAARLLRAILHVRSAQALALVSAVVLSAGLAAMSALLHIVRGRFAAILFVLLCAPTPMVAGLSVATLSDAAGMGLALLCLCALTAMWWSERRDRSAAGERMSTSSPLLHRPPLTSSSSFGAVAASVSSSGLPQRGTLGWLIVSGLLCGAALGVRPQTAVVLILGGTLVCADHVLRGGRLRGTLVPLLLTAAAATFAWLLPFAALQGPRHLFDLCVQHARGHFHDFGGSAMTVAADGGMQGAPWLGRIVAATQTLGGALGPLVPALILCCGYCVLRSEWSARRQAAAAAVQPGGARDVGAVLRLSAPLWAGAVGYLIFALAALRVAGSGRHLLPVIIALCGAVALTCDALLRSVGARRAVLLAAAAVGALGARDAAAFRRSSAPGAQLAADLPRCDPRVQVYGARAARYVDLRCGVGSAQPAIYLGEILSDLSRRSNPPAEVLLTSEVIASAAARDRLRVRGRYCYSAEVPSLLRWDTHAGGGRRDRGAGADCVELLAYRVWP